MDSSVVNFYTGRSVFITGGSGFIGKVLIEKLLSSCPDIGRIYLLIRPSRDGKTAQYRLQEELCKSQVFTLRNVQLNLDKLVAINGDITKPGLGLSKKDYQQLCENVSVIFHSAATVQFQGPLKKFFQQNVLGTESILKMAREMKNLKVVIYVSTAYSNCNRIDVEERVYPVVDNVQTLIDRILLEDSDESPFEGHPSLMGRPNSYTISKAVAETLIEQLYSDIPVVICRPSIVTHANREPAEGWCDSLNGLAGAFLLGGLGIARTFEMKCDYNADIIPVDFVANSLIVIGYHSSVYPVQRKQVVHITSSQKNPISWGQLLDYYRQYSIKYPSIKSIRPIAPNPLSTTGFMGKTKHYYHKIVDHILVAYIIDFFQILFGRKCYMVEMISKLHRSSDVLKYFTNVQWSFMSQNYEDILVQLSDHDQHLFQSNPNDIIWSDYVKNLYIGTRRYLLKEDDATITNARKRLTRLFWTWKIAPLFPCFLIIALISIFKCFSFGQVI